MLIGKKGIGIHEINNLSGGKLKVRVVVVVVLVVVVIVREVGATTASSRCSTSLCGGKKMKENCGLGS